MANEQIRKQLEEILIRNHSLVVFLDKTMETALDSTTEALYRREMALHLELGEQLKEYLECGSFSVVKTPQTKYTLSENKIRGLYAEDLIEECLQYKNRLSAMYEDIDPDKTEDLQASEMVLVHNFRLKDSMRELDSLLEFY